MRRTRRTLATHPENPMSDINERTLKFTRPELRPAHLPFKPHISVTSKQAIAVVMLMEPFVHNTNDTRLVGETLVLRNKLYTINNCARR